MIFKILRYREFDNDYVALCNGIEVIIDPFVSGCFEYQTRRTHIGNTYQSNGRLPEPYKNVFIPEILDLIEEQ